MWVGVGKAPRRTVSSTLLTREMIFMWLLSNQIIFPVEKISLPVVPLPACKAAKHTDSHLQKRMHERMHSNNRNWRTERKGKRKRKRYTERARGKACPQGVFDYCVPCCSRETHKIGTNQECYRVLLPHENCRPEDWIYRPVCAVGLIWELGWYRVRSFAGCTADARRPHRWRSWGSRERNERWNEPKKRKKELPPPPDPESGWHLPLNCHAFIDAAVVPVCTKMQKQIGLPNGLSKLLVIYPNFVDPFDPIVQK